MKEENLEFNRGGDFKTCPSCLAINDECAVNCQRCNARIGSNLDPLGIIQSEGEVWRKATTTRPKFIVLLGTWIIFFPVLVTAVALGLSMVTSGGGSTGFLFFWLSVAMTIVSVFFLYQVTNNYFTMNKKINKE